MTRSPYWLALVLYVIKKSHSPFSTVAISKGAGTKEGTLIEILCSRTNKQIAEAKAAFKTSLYLESEFCGLVGSGWHRIIAFTGSKFKSLPITTRGWLYGVTGFFGRHFFVSRHCDGDAYLLSVAVLPSPPPKEGSYSCTTPIKLQVKAHQVLALLWTLSTVVSALREFAHVIRDHTVLPAT